MKEREYLPPPNRRRWLVELEEVKYQTTKKSSRTKK